MSNTAMTGKVKIGESNNIPRRLKEANKPETWKPPNPYKLEYVLMTDNHKAKEKEIHSFLENQGKRIREGMNTEFFLATPAEVLPLFQLMTGVLIDGETFLLQRQQANDSDEDVSDETSDSVVMATISEVSAADNDELDEQSVRQFERHDYTVGTYDDWSKRKRASYKSIRREKQGLYNPIFTSVASKQGLRSWADWSVDRMSFVLKENYAWITPEIRAVLKDCFP